ncbi:MAG: hypothetical protein ABEI07_01715 [Candidatus Nanohaloarchaea archaeon]
MEEPLEYDGMSMWKDGVSEENIRALAEVTLDLAAKIDYIAENSEQVRDAGQRLEHLMHLGQRALEAEKRLRSDDTLGEGYLEPGIYNDVADTEEIEEMMEELDIDEERDLDDYAEIGESLALYPDDPVDELYEAQHSYHEALQKLEKVEGVEPVWPEVAV